MPTQTFFNLPGEKRARILAAIKDEFARVPFEEVSINRIVQEAEIPRGSFYQYFADKTDMLGYVLSDYKAFMDGVAMESLAKHHGDIFHMFLDALDFTVDFVTKGQTNAFLHNLLSDVRINTSFNSSFTGYKERGAVIREISAHVNRELLDIRGDDDLSHMLGILLTVTADAIAQVFFDLSRYAEIRSSYVKRLSLLKRGFLRDKEEDAAL